MRIASLIILCTLIAGTVAPGTARADAVANFVRESFELDPDDFRPEDYHRDFRATIVLDGQTFVLNRDQVIQSNQAAMESYSEYRLTEFALLGRRSEGEKVLVEFTYAYEAVSAGTRIYVSGKGNATLVPGGPNGYLWLRSMQKDTVSEGS